MKHLISLLCLSPLVSFSQRILPQINLDTSVIRENRISSIVKREIQILGDSVIYDKKLEKVTFDEKGFAMQQVSWKVWSEDSSTSMLTENQVGRIKTTLSCNYRSQPHLQKICDVTGLKCLPAEFSEYGYFVNDPYTIGESGEMKNTINDSVFIEFVSDIDTSGLYRDDLDMRTIIRIDLKNNWIEYQTAFISNPPTDVPRMSYHRTVYHYDFSMRLLWKDGHVANLGYYDFGESDSQTIYDYYENGILKRELTFFENNPYGYNSDGIFIEQILYEITYFE